MTDLRTQLIEAAAKADYDTWNDPKHEPWETQEGSTREDFLVAAEAIVDAILDTLVENDERVSDEARKRAGWGDMPNVTNVRRLVAALRPPS